MAGFVSHFTNRLDAKGRVSIPAPFRAVLARDGFDGLYCFNSTHNPAVDAGGNELLAAIKQQTEKFAKLTSNHDMLASALFGASETLKIDGDGRMILTDSIRAHTGVTDQVTFVGLDYKFQIWEPEKYNAYRVEALKKMQDILDSLGGGPSQGEPA